MRTMLLGIIAVCLLAILACSSEDNADTEQEGSPTATEAATDEPTREPTAEATPEPTAEPTPVPTAPPTQAPVVTQPPAQSNCSPSYPTVCIPPPPPDLDCGDITFRRFTVLPPDPHGFDGNDNDGIGCESG